MTIQITAIRTSTRPADLTTITTYLFAGRNGEVDGWFQKAQAVQYVRAHPQTVWVGGAGASAWVEVVEGPTPYLRSHPDGTQADNLLSPPGLTGAMWLLTASGR